MLKQILVPIEENHIIELPEHLFGKQIEVQITEIGEANYASELPDDLKDQAFWSDIPFDSSFPSIDQIRSSAWPSR